MIRRFAHIVTADAVALGAPEVLVFEIGDDDADGGRLVEKFPLKGEQPPVEVLRDAGWSLMEELTLVGQGYHVVEVS